ncbi:MAG: Mur ligase family protein [bacterium]|nr:Mur ligase family protein [bacterium]
MKTLLRQLIVWVITLEARLVLKKYKPKIVGITASVGKTSMKEGVALALSASFNVYSSRKSYNSEIGMPLSILMSESGWSSPLSWVRIVLEGLGLVLFPSDYPEWLVLELGVDHPGDMKAHVSWLKLDVAVLGRVGDMPAHLEYFDSPEALLREKALIIKGIKTGGYFVYSADDELVGEVARSYSGPRISFGYLKNANVRATHERTIYHTKNKVKYPSGFSYKLDYQNEVHQLTFNDVFGATATYATLCGFAVAMSQKLDPDLACAKISTFASVPGRLRILEGKKGSIIIDDTYNSSPVALSLALGHLEQIKYSKRKIAVLGDMLELGSSSPEAHRAVGELASEIVDKAYFVGARMKFARDAYVSKKGSDEAVSWFATSQEVGKALEYELAAGDIVLVKGSQGIRMEHVVKDIMAEPTRASELLVRQEKQWKVR